ncbi:MAG TPA: energy transducer TonB [Steroidobacteraceae bacterium]|jgi:protein TonB
MNVMLHTFPSLHSFNSRSWALLLIVMLHLGFFWALTEGLSIRILGPLAQTSTLVPVNEARPLEPLKPRMPTEVKTFGTHLDPQTSDPHPVTFTWDEVTPPSEIGLPPPQGRDFSAEPRGPVVVSPSIDPTRGLSEPLYPPQEIRLQHTGTVLLAVQILANGRVGEVRIDSSSGYPRLDASAAREAKDWRFRPGTSDGVAVTMWKQVPITFKLK